MKPDFRKIALALATVAALSPAHAGMLTFQNLVHKTTWSNQVLTLEIGAGQHSGDWTRATSIGAVSFKDMGSIQSVTVTAAPQGVEAWKMTTRELTADGCGDGSNRDTTSLCLTGAPVAWTDNMVFSFAFTGTHSLEQPHFAVSFFDDWNNKVGDVWWSQPITSAPIVVTPPDTPPVTTPVTPPVTLPVVPPVTAPVATSEVPEPRTIALLLGGLTLMGLTLRKRT